MEYATRREVLAACSALGAAALLSGCAGTAQAQEEGAARRPKPGQVRAAAAAEGRPVRWGMLIDARKCVDCDACLEACHRQNGLPEGMDFIRFIPDEIGGTSRKVTQIVPVQCMHCADAPCAAVCPTRATTVGEDGIVSVDETRCIGCKYCMAACPYQARVYNEATGTVDKCRFCAAKSQEGDKLHVSCVEACINHARVFGDLNDPESEVSRAIVEGRAKPLAGDLTEVSIYYVR